MRETSAITGALDTTAASTGLALDVDEIIDGLTSQQKRLEPRFLYDERGSELFEQITWLPEYYATRTELALLAAHASEIASLAGSHATVVDLGAGSSCKARVLLGALDQPRAYVPVDISASYLELQAKRVAKTFPKLSVVPLAADFTAPLEIPRFVPTQNLLLFFPGSTIGNLTRPHAEALLAQLRQIQPRDHALLIGVDICSDARALYAAYNDSSGVTAAFNLNLLARMNRELGANFDLSAFEHVAPYDEQEQRIEMRLVSRRRQTVRVAGRSIDFMRGEHLITEYSHKYRPADFAALARAAGWQTEACWTDDLQRFSVHFLRSEADERADGEAQA